MKNLWSVGRDFILLFLFNSFFDRTQTENKNPCQDLLTIVIVKGYGPDHTEDHAVKIDTIIWEMEYLLIGIGPKHSGTGCC